ncbi:MAG: beta-N-acetylhexosaminidase [Deltaproteobacteria bacterium]|nr:beta-N-acetylhexosaminidase [Deltaproteobacteria bacterium]
MERFIRKKSLEELVGQLFMVGFEGTGFNSDLSYFLKKLHVGGAIYFKRNVQDPFQLAELSRSLQEKAMEISSIPLLIAIDQEGGSVARLGTPFTQFESQSAMASADEPEARVRFFAQTQARELKLMGINMNLTPVLDVNLRGPEGIMASRSYGSDPYRVSELGTLCIREFQQNGIMACPKHFPGIGDTDLDSHEDLPIQLKDKTELERVELVPFREALKIPPAAVMVSHIRYPAYDLKHPASLSESIISGLLRKTLGYDGLVVTDDLEMGAIGKHYEIEEALFLTFTAGVDCLMICHSPDKIERGYFYLLNKIKKGTISEDRFKKSLGRILTLKQKFLQSFFPLPEKEIKEYFLRK